MKKIVLFAIAFLMVNVLFAGPFGLEMGMTLEEIKEKCGWNNVEHIEKDMYKIKPPGLQALLTIILYLLMILLVYIPLLRGQKLCLTKNVYYP